MKNYRAYDEDMVLYSNEYAEHVSAMTGEKLHSKSELAMELAWRDIKIKELEDQLRFLVNNDSINDHSIEREVLSLLDGQDT